MHVGKKRHYLLLLKTITKFLKWNHFREKIEKFQSKKWILDIDDQGLKIWVVAKMEKIWAAGLKPATF